MKKKLGIVAFNFPPMLGGMENHAVGLTTALREYVDLTVFTARHNDPYDCPFEVQRILSRDIREDAPQLLKHACDGWLVLSAGYAALTKELPLPVIVYCHGNDFLAPIVLQRMCGERTIDHLDAVPGLWRFKEELQSLTRSRRRRRVLESLAHAAQIFANSEFTKAALLRLSPDLSGKVSVSHPGVEERFFTQPLVHTKPRQSFPIRIMTIARLQSFARRKNVDGCLRALASIRDRAQFVYDIVGDGDDRARLEALSEELGLRDRIRFLGRISESEIISRLDETDLFLLAPVPGENDIEGFGIVYAEAAARGTPSLLTAQGPVDTVREGTSGIIVLSPSQEHVAEGILRFVRERDKFESQAIRAFSERFRWPAIVDKMRPILEACLDGREVSVVN